jgi:hypothetical protein
MNHSAKLEWKYGEIFFFKIIRRAKEVIWIIKRNAKEAFWIKIKRNAKEVIWIDIKINTMEALWIRIIQNDREVLKIRFKRNTEEVKGIRFNRNAEDVKGNRFHRYTREVDSLKQAVEMRGIMILLITFFNYLFKLKRLMSNSESWSMSKILSISLSLFYLQIERVTNINHWKT